MISVDDYLQTAQALIDSGQYTDGCTAPFKTYVHRWLKNSRMLCAAHDFGSLGLIDGVGPGWQNNWMTLLAHLKQKNPVYWLWGFAVATATLPWVIWRRNLNITFIPFLPFHAFILLFGVFFGIYFYFGN